MTFWQKHKWKIIAGADRARPRGGVRPWRPEYAEAGEKTHRNSRPLLPGGDTGAERGRIKCRTRLRQNRRRRPQKTVSEPSDDPQADKPARMTPSRQSIFRRRNRQASATGEYEEVGGMMIDTGTGKDKYQTDPVPEGKPLPVEPEDVDGRRRGIYLHAVHLLRHDSRQHGPLQ